MTSTAASVALWRNGFLGSLGIGRRALRDVTRATAPARDLAANATIRIADPLRCQVRCVSGLLWLTHDGDRKDLILGPGEQYLADRSSTLLAHALQASRLELIWRD